MGLIRYLKAFSLIVFLAHMLLIGAPSVPNHPYNLDRLISEDGTATIEQPIISVKEATIHHFQLSTTLRPGRGKIFLDQVTRKDVKDLVAMLNTQGLTKRTILNVLTPLRELYNHAIDDRTVSTNPVSKVGTIVKGCKATSAHIDPLTAMEVMSLLTTARERYQFIYPLLLCAVRTGLREGELIGPRWEDVDFLRAFIEVRNNVVRRQETTPKTNRIRRVDVSPQLGKELLQLKETRQLETSLKGQALPKWVFLTPHGNRMTNEVLRKGFYACLEAAGLRRIRFMT